MLAKVFKVKDRDTVLHVLAVSLKGVISKEKAILNSVGLGEGSSYSVQLTDLATGESQRDKYKWVTYGRTLTTVHDYLEHKLDDLDNGSTIDVEKLRM